jgi:hypothetical protein
MDLRRRELDFNRGLGQNSAQFDASEPVFGACGAAALYRRRVLDEIGFLDEDFFLYDEDTDPISVVNWLVGSVSISLSRERRSNSKFALLPTVTPRKPAVYYPSGLPKKQKSLHKVQAYSCCNQL